VVRVQQRWRRTGAGPVRCLVASAPINAVFPAPIATTQRASSRNTDLILRGFFSDLSPLLHANLSSTHPSGLAMIKLPVENKPQLGFAKPGRQNETAHYKHTSVSQCSHHDLDVKWQSLRGTPSQIICSVARTPTTPHFRNHSY